MCAGTGGATYSEWKPRGLRAPTAVGQPCHTRHDALHACSHASLELGACSSLLQATCPTKENRHAPRIILPQLRFEPGSQSSPYHRSHHFLGLHRIQRVARWNLAKKLEQLTGLHRILSSPKSRTHQTQMLMRAIPMYPTWHACIHHWYRSRPSRSVSVSRPGSMHA